MHYYPPKMAGIPDEDFEIDQHVVRATYRAHDMMLQSLLHLVGPDTTVVLVSDHGFHSGHLRPEFTPRVPAGITVWHRNQGVILAKGPGIAAGQDLHGARLLDVAPTLLHHFGSPVGDDMEGRVLHVEQMLAKLRQRADVDFIEIDYPALVADPNGQLPALHAFLGAFGLHPTHMQSAIRPDLHRNRSEALTA